MLYSLDPWTDPHGALLHLDYLAHKAGMTQWILDVWDFFSKAGDDDGFRNRLRPTVLPGWAYARALALYSEEESKKSVRAVQHSFVTQPLTFRIGSRSEYICFGGGHPRLPVDRPGSR